MRKPFSSVAIRIMLLTTVVLPSLVLLLFQTSSMAAGVLLVSGLYIFLFVAFSAVHSNLKVRIANAVLIASLIGLVMMHGTINILINNDFDFNRFSQSYLFLIIFFLGATFFVLLAQKVPMFQADIAIKFVFYVLALSSIAGILHFSPFPTEVRRPVFFYTEPSHFALSFLPFLLYMTVTARSGKKLILVLLGYAIALLLQSLTLVVGVTLITILTIPLWRWLVLIPIAATLIIFSAFNYEYYLSRLDFSNPGQNLSVLVFLSGWERAYLNFIETFGLGVGFQQFGIIGSRGEVRELLRRLGAENLNLLDGGAVAPKFIGEFGMLGVVLLIAYLVYFVKSVRWLHGVSMSAVVPRECKRIFFLSCFVMYCIDFFVRGTAYFSSTGFLFVSSLAWMAVKKKEMRHL